MSVVRSRRELRLACPPEALWPLVSNTDRLNRELGLPAAEPGPYEDDHARPSSARVLGLTVRWRELPFEYSEGRFYRVRREFLSGPVARLDATVRLEPLDGGSRVVIESEFALRHRAARPFVALAAAKAGRDVARVFARYDGCLKSGVPAAAPRRDAAADVSRLEARGRALKEACSAVGADRLLAHLASAPDDEVVRMRPFELADRWGLPRREVLATFLNAVRAGLLDLSWDVLCPNCAGGDAHASLSELTEKGHCATCALDFTADLSESVELRFTAHPGVRPADVKLYCVGSPAHSRHALAQLSLEPGLCPAGFPVTLEARSYVLRGLGSMKRLVLRPRPDGPAELALDLAAAEDGAELAFRPGEVRLRFAPRPGELVRVEREDWKAAAATAALVASLQCFRDLFSSEVLAPGARIGVKRVALLFTDLKGSTALYERVGDAAAYALVRDHFDYLFAIVAARGGAVVKTIGDAVMAAFSSPADALEAALEMQARVGELNARLAPRPPVTLKIGVHEGPAIAINADGRLDYFGTTANAAARVQNESEGGDVVIMPALREDPAVAEVLARLKPGSEEFRASLRGLSGEFALLRLRV